MVVGIEGMVLVCGHMSGAVTARNTKHGRVWVCTGSVG